MGYSCTQDARNTLAVIGNMFKTDGNPNILTIGTIAKKRYFFERGQEQDDGAITGTLMVMLPCDCLFEGKHTDTCTSNFCKNVGSVRIEPDGTITRFPKLIAADRREIENSARDMQARNPQLLHSWGAAL